MGMGCMHAWENMLPCSNALGEKMMKNTVGWGMTYPQDIGTPLCLID